MTETVTLIILVLGAIVTWTTSVILLVLWLTGKFRGLEKALYREMDKHRREDDRMFDGHQTRIQRLELKTFGFAVTGDPPPADRLPV